MLLAVKISEVFVVIVWLVSLLVLLVREGLFWEMVEVLALTEEGTSEDPLTFVPGRSTCLLSGLC